MTETMFDKKTQKIEWIPVEQISVIWAQAQREFNEKHAKVIADNFDPEMFGTLAVTLPNGKGIYHVIDGQHRRAAIEMLYGPKERVPCEIFNATEPSRAAKLFDKINTARKAPQPLESFRVRITAGDKDENAVAKIIKENGYVLAKGGTRAENSIACVGALLAVYRIHGAEALGNALKLIQATWGMDKSATGGQFVRGYGEFMAEFGKKVNWGRLKESIAKKYTPARFMGAVKTAREMSGGSTASAVKSLLLANYNRGLRANLHVVEKQKSE
jgi:hypothetical protein